jgi:DNA-3-methyladenine glycosylase I
LSREATRCDWAGSDPIYVRYHDREWGVPVRRDRKLFEMLIHEGAQAGLSWITILKKRARYREVFERFDPKTVAAFDERRIQQLLQDPGIVRNRAKVRSAVGNAQAFLEIRQEFGTFSRYLWKFVDGKPIVNRPKSMSDVPAETEISQQLSRDLKRRGMLFVGPTIMYAFMQSVGMVNDHLVGCFRHREVKG